MRALGFVVLLATAWRLPAACGQASGPSSRPATTIPASAPAPVTVGDLVINQRDFGPATENHDFEGTGVVSADAMHYVGVERTDDGERVWFDGQPGRKYRQVSWHVPASVSATGGRHAYLAASGDEWLLVVDGKEIRGYQDCGPVVFSRDGKRWACFADTAKATVLLLDGKEQDKFDKRAEKPPGNIWKMTFDADGDLNCTAIRGGKTVLLLKGKEIPLPGIVEEGNSKEFSPDGRHFLYQAKEGKQNYYVIDGRAGPRRYGYLNLLEFSPDGRLIVYYASPDGIQPRRLYLDEVPPALGGRVYEGNYRPVFRPDGSVGAMLVGQGPPVGRCRVLIDGQLRADEGSVDSISFSLDGKRYAYSVFTGGMNAQSGGSMYVVVDGKRGPMHWRLGAPQFSPDGKHVAYVASDVREEADKWVGRSTPQVYLDGVKIAPTCQAIGHGTLAWHPDSRHVAFAIRTEKGEKQMLIAGPQEKRYPLHESQDDVLPFRPWFTRDGRHLVWVAGILDRQGLVVDGQKVLEADRIIDDSFRAADGGGFQVLAVEKGRVIFVQARPAK